MAKTEQVLVLDPPNELKFRGPFNEVVTSRLKLSNPTDKLVCFKVKTTAPKRYCVRPNSGLINGSGFVDVAVMLQPFEYDPNEKNKHKFMVQTLFPPDGDTNIDLLFKDAQPNQLMDSKLRCVFELLADDARPPSQNNLDTVPQTQVDTKASPKLSPALSKTNVAETELMKACDEIKILRQECSALRQNNIGLKEDMLRMETKDRSGGDSSTKPATIILSSESKGLFSNNFEFIGIVVIMFIIGFFLGKFIF